MSVERRTHVRFSLAFLLFVLSGVAFLDRTNLSIAGLQISTEYGLGNQRLGWIFSAFLIGYAGFQLPAGWLATRYGPRRVLTLGVLWWGITTGLTALMFGITLREHDERYLVADEWATLLRQLWTVPGESAFAGTYFQVERGCSDPKPVQDPYPVIMTKFQAAAGKPEEPA